MNLLVVTRPLNTQVRRHRHILNNNTLPIPARHPHTRLRSSHSTRNLKEVVISPLRRLPRLAVSRHLELGRPPVGVYYLRREPVLRHAGFEVDGQRPGDGRAAVDELVGRVDYALGGVGFEGGPGVLEEVEVAGVAFGAFVYDLLQPRCQFCFGFSHFLCFILVPLSVSSMDRIGFGCSPSQQSTSPHAKPSHTRRSWRRCPRLAR
jgi:hypothetical protein